MQAWIAGVLAILIPKLLEWLWTRASDELKDKLAEDRIRAHVKEALTAYEKLILERDDLYDKGQLTQEKEQEIINEKVRLETDILNGASRLKP